ncbi:MAG TPA: S1C family serine protease, partial [Tepidisphaeraceae bacterium]|nr:S1C family serine protease [Tepidisphaeraceae bacterium]
MPRDFGTSGLYMGRRLRGRRSLGARLLGAAFATFLFSCPPSPAAAGDGRGATAVAAAYQVDGKTASRSDTLVLAGLEDQFEQLADRLAPSVVAISATTRSVDRDELVRSDALSADKLAAAVFDHATRTVGTGFVVDANGYILTNDHVVGAAEQIWVTT